MTGTLPDLVFAPFEAEHYAFDASRLAQTLLGGTMEADFQTTSAPPRVTLSTCTIDVETTPNKLIVSIIGEVDMADADRVGEVLIEAASAGKPIVCVDLSGLEFADSSAVKAILLGANAAEENGVTYELINPHGSVSRLLGVTGLSDALTVIDEPDHREGPNSL